MTARYVVRRFYLTLDLGSRINNQFLRKTLKVQITPNATICYAMLSLMIYIFPFWCVGFSINYSNFIVPTVLSISLILSSYTLSSHTMKRPTNCIANSSYANQHIAVTTHTTSCCSMQVVDITLMKLHSTNITSLRVVQQKHCGST
jgi:hypothetical protein